MTGSVRGATAPEARRRVMDQAVPGPRSPEEESRELPEEVVESLGRHRKPMGSILQAAGVAPGSLQGPRGLPDLVPESEVREGLS